MKFLMYSCCGEGAQILKRIQDEGNECALFIKDKIYKNVFDGILDKVEEDAIASYVDDDTTTIFDMSGNGNIAEDLRRQGYFVYGASKFADKLEHDRNFGFSIMEQCGIKIPEYKEFKSFQDGIEYVQASKARLVFKPNGSMPCKLTYVSDDSEQLVQYLKFVEKRFSKDIKSFILQEFIEGCVVSSEIFVSCGKVLFPHNHTVEVKKSMNDDLGPSTGCSGNITWNCTRSKIIDKGVMRAASIFRGLDYTGQIDLNAVVNESGVYGLEWTPRFGYDATPTYLTLLDIDYGQFFADCARGDLKKEFSKSEQYAGSIRISIPPYPMEVKSGLDTEKVSPNEGIPIQNWEDIQEDCYFYEVMIDDDKLEHSGGTGVICLGIGHGDTPEKSLDTPYKIAEQIKIPDKQYRTDLKEVLGKMVKEVEQYA